MNKNEIELWNRLKSFELDDPESMYTFSERLALENNWKLNFSLRVIDEYKKFIFLICISDKPLTPSDEVDQAWHLHLIYTNSYWKEMCQTILKKEIHHGPTKGGESENNKFMDCYEYTLEKYRTIFKVEPPSDIWPISEKRFSDIHFRRINIKKNWVISKFIKFA